MKIKKNNDKKNKCKIIKITSIKKKYKESLFLKKKHENYKFALQYLLEQQSLREIY
jgi:hypothetical protein